MHARSCHQHSLPGEVVEVGGRVPLVHGHPGGRQVQDPGCVVHLHEGVRVGVEEVGRCKGLPPHADVADCTPHERHGVDLRALVERDLVQEGVGCNVVGLPHVRGHGAEGRELHDLLQLRAGEDEALRLGRLLARRKSRDTLAAGRGRGGPDAGAVLLRPLLREGRLRVPGRLGLQGRTGGGVRGEERLGVPGRGQAHDLGVRPEFRGQVPQRAADAGGQLQGEPPVLPELLRSVPHGLRVPPGALHDKGPVVPERRGRALQRRGPAHLGCLKQ
mmetsp:Transcript_95454/g.308058  ORF Transcript_95454/g.308058 Transcript_95454/m.308058 type:complete len:274 (+) Transcript_95454:864-1685(+)